jgi:outer membrane protein assembly factor BamB
LGLVILTLTALRAAAADWPEFRGSGGRSVAEGAVPPIEWTTTKNVAWKQTVPGAGWSSPVVSGGRIYLTTGIPAPTGNPALNVLCLDVATGRIEWQTEIFSPAESPQQPRHDKSLPASPTPVIDGDRIYVYFGHHGAACLDRTGRIIWRNPRLRFDPVPGNGNSPVIAGDRLIYMADCATAAFTVALDKHTGRTLWRVPRTLPAKMKFAFGTPLLISVNRQPQLLVPSDAFLAALDPKDGREIWRVRLRERYAVLTQPVFAHGLVYTGGGYNRGELLAVRPDGQGDVTDTHVVWRVSKGAPMTPAVVAVGHELYAVNDAGVATCWDAATGNVRWQERLEGNYTAAPIVAGGRIYFQNETGTGTVIKAATEFTRLATNRLEEPILASYAVADGALFIRTATQLYRIGRSE